MSYAQWMNITVKAIGFDCKINKLSLKWGKLYRNNDKDKEIQASEINNTIIKTEPVIHLVHADVTVLRQGLREDFLCLTVIWK